MKYILSHFPTDIDPIHVMPFTHMDFISDSTASFRKSKAGYFGYEYYLDGIFKDTFLKKTYAPIEGATLSSLTRHLVGRQTYWTNRRLD